jgi:hypothetical protein
VVEEGHMTAKEQCNEEQDGHACTKQAGHRGWHEDMTGFSPSKGGATYGWMSCAQYQSAGWIIRERQDR